MISLQSYLNSLDLYKILNPFKNEDIVDFNLDCLKHQYKLLRINKLDSQITDVFTIKNGDFKGFGFTKISDWTLGIPIIHQSCHCYFPYSLQSLLLNTNYFTELSKELGIPISLETIMPQEYWCGFYGVSEKVKDKFLWLNSPICELKNSYEETLNSLTRKRRYKIKEANKQHQDLHVDVRSNCLSDYELDWCKATLRDKYEDEDYEYALSQVLWSQSISNLTNNNHWFIIKRGEEILCISSFIIKPEFGHYTAYFQVNIQNSYDNLGAFMLSKVLAFFNIAKSLNIKYIDTTCRTSLFESSIDTYKRIIVNKDKQLPLFMISYKPVEDVLPPICINNEWQTNGIEIQGDSI